MERCGTVVGKSWEHQRRPTMPESKHPRRKTKPWLCQVTQIAPPHPEWTPGTKQPPPFGSLVALLRRAQLPPMRRVGLVPCLYFARQNCRIASTCPSLAGHARVYTLASTQSVLQYHFQPSNIAPIYRCPLSQMERQWVQGLSSPSEGQVQRALSGHARH